MELDSAWKRCQLSENFPFLKFVAFIKDQHHVSPKKIALETESKTLVIIKQMSSSSSKVSLPKIKLKKGPASLNPSTPSSKKFEKAKVMNTGDKLGF